MFDYTDKANMIAIVSDGTRILGLGNVGPEAGLPVMEGKAILFKKFGGVDAMPICIENSTEDELVEFIKKIAPSFGAINVEDVESPKAFNVVRRAQENVSIPIFHDDQQGTAVVTIAALLNACKLAGKGKDAKIVINGAGTAGYGVAKLALYAGFKDVSVLDSKGAIYEGRKEDMNPFKEEIARQTNSTRKAGGLEEVARGADVLIGLSKKGLFTNEIIQGMNEKPIVFALANPSPEIEYEDAKNAGAFIAATGRSDRPNQVNNVLAFPSIMRGLLDVRAKGINEEMLYRASLALAKSVGRELGQEQILPQIMGRRFSTSAANIAVAVADAAGKTGMARMTRSKEEIKKEMKAMLKRYASIEKKLIKD